MPARTVFAAAGNLSKPDAAEAEHKYPSHEMLDQEGLSFGGNGQAIILVETQPYFMYPALRLPDHWFLVQGDFLPTNYYDGPTKCPPSTHRHSKFSFLAPGKR
jgi:hypothetical protein